MTFDEILGQVLQLLQRQGPVSDRALMRRFNFDAVVVQSIGSDLCMDDTAVGQTTRLAACMEQIMIHYRASMLPADMM